MVSSGTEARMAEMPTGTVTFLFTDIEGSTRLWNQHPERMDSVIANHDRELREIVEAHSGFVFKTVGDALYTVFRQTLSAISASIALQLFMQEKEWDIAEKLKIRIGIVTGEAHLRGEDYVGLAVNRCRRLCDAGHGGQILIDQATASIAADHLPANSAMRDLGAHTLKDLQIAQIYQVLHTDLLPNFPPLRSLEQLSGNLPHQITSFIGRTEEVEIVKELLETTRLLTLTGSGGCGKTRLSQQVAGEMIDTDHYSDGIWLIELQALTEGNRLAPTVASTLSISEEPGRALLATIIDSLKPKSLLLLLDNCEHLIEDCAAFAKNLLRSCPRLHILATSREPLGITGETSWRVPSLPAPASDHLPSAALLATYPAAQLFIERASAALPGFQLTAGNAPAISRICQRLDGIPLALEIAAARVKGMSVEHIDAQLFKVILGNGSATGATSPIEAAIDWSYRLLTPEEQSLFCRLSVFTNGFVLEAAEAVAGLHEWELEAARYGGTNGVPTEAAHSAAGPASATGNLGSATGNPAMIPGTADVLDLLLRLVDKSLVIYEEQVDGNGRYRLLEMLRQYGWQKLTLEQAEALRERHRDWYLEFAEKAELELRGAEQGTWLTRLEKDHDNLCAALKWSVDAVPRLRLAGALLGFWLKRGYLSEGRGWLEGALAQRGNVPALIRAKALKGAGTLAWAQENYPVAKQYFEECLALYESMGDTHGVANTLNNLGIVATRQGEYISAEDFTRRSIELHRLINNDYAVASGLTNLGVIAFDQGDYPTALPNFEQALTLMRRLERQQEVATILHNIGEILRKQTRYAEAENYLSDSLELRQKMKDTRGIAFSLGSLATTAARVNEYERAATLYASAETARQTVGIPLRDDDREDVEHDLPILRKNLDEKDFLFCWNKGNTIPVEEAIRFALRQGNG